MGSSRWDPDEWTSHSASVASTPTAKIYTTTASTASTVTKHLLPTNYKFRESCDSVPNPVSTPVIVGIDVTGSMGSLASQIVREGLGTVVQELYDRKPVHDPHVLLMAIGDVESDKYPIQATQFEADTTIIKQLTDFYLEGNGGGNMGESYNVAWYFAAQRTKTDSFLKRKKKGYLFTVGDEAPLSGLSKSAIKEFFGDDVQGNLTNRELLTMASREWEVFHFIIDEDSSVPTHHSFVHHDEGKAKWRDLLGQRAMILTDHRDLAKVIVSVIQANEGGDVDKIADSWKSDSTALVVRKAIGDLAVAGGSGSGVTRL